VAGSLRVVRDEGLAGYDFGGGHLLAPIQGELAVALARELGVLDALVHDADCLAAVRRAAPDIRHGLGTGDSPTFPGLHEASALVVGASVAAAARQQRRRPARLNDLAHRPHEDQPLITTRYTPWSAKSRSGLEYWGMPVPLPVPGCLGPSIRLCLAAVRSRPEPAPSRVASLTGRERDVQPGDHQLRCDQIPHSLSQYHS
jgi:hypothetical protein